MARMENLADPARRAAGFELTTTTGCVVPDQHPLCAIAAAEADCFAAQSSYGLHRRR
jgi:hypothetical protein